MHPAAAASATAPAPSSEPGPAHLPALPRSEPSTSPQPGANHGKRASSATIMVALLVAMAAGAAAWLTHLSPTPRCFSPASPRPPLLAVWLFASACEQTPPPKAPRHAGAGTARRAAAPPRPMPGRDGARPGPILHRPVGGFARRADGWGREALFPLPVARRLGRGPGGVAPRSRSAGLRLPRSG